MKERNSNLILKEITWIITYIISFCAMVVCGRYIIEIAHAFSIYILCGYMVLVIALSTFAFLSKVKTLIIVTKSLLAVSLILPIVAAVLFTVM
ncbi:MAG: hypothetical protein E7266_08600 [Lachnospiraceae bacterium]|nr:hypothetical protein [Lachnospiraceae bacterium]